MQYGVADIEGMNVSAERVFDCSLNGECVLWVLMRLNRRYSY